jgi:hypothetical protein
MLEYFEALSDVEMFTDRELQGIWMFTDRMTRYVTNGTYHPLVWRAWREYFYRLLVDVVIRSRDLGAGGFRLEEHRKSPLPP